MSKPMIRGGVFVTRAATEAEQRRLQKFIREAALEHAAALALDGIDIADVEMPTFTFIVREDSLERVERDGAVQR